MYIRRLKYCIGKMGGWNGVLYRGINLSNDEIGEMVRLKRFYIASFTSASTSIAKAFSGNTILKIDATDARWALPMNHQLSKYHDTEAEVLLTCYTLFDFVKRDGKVVSLKVVDLGGGWYSKSYQCVLSLRDGSIQDLDRSAQTIQWIFRGKAHKGRYNSDCTEINWSDDDVWTRPKPGLKALFGEWFSKSFGTREKLMAGRISSHDPATKTFTWVCNNKTYTGTYNDDGSRISWNDGDVWMRSPEPSGCVVM